LTTIYKTSDSQQEKIGVRYLV